MNKNAKAVKHSVIQGNCLEKLQAIPNESIDFICADFPYNISGQPPPSAPRHHRWNVTTRDVIRFFLFHAQADFRRPFSHGVPPRLTLNGIVDACWVL